MKTIAIDMDNVIADVESHYIDWYERDYGVRINKNELTGVPELEAFPNKSAVRRFLDTPGFFRTVPVVHGAQEAVKELMKKFEIYIVSAAMEFPNSLKEKYQWLEEHFPFISWKQIVFCGSKSVIDTDFMIDDHLKNLNYCKGRGILYSACHNRFVDYPTRVENWEEAISYFNSNS